MNNFVKFFEIGKLEKGLFRIWIVLAIAWIAYVFVVDTFDWRYKNYQKEKYENNACLSIPGGRWMITSQRGDIGLFYLEGFDTLNECKKVAHSKRNNFYLALILTILSPFSLIIIWLFGKKITLWIRRGFK